MLWQKRFFRRVDACSRFLFFSGLTRKGRTSNAFCFHPKNISNVMSRRNLNMSLQFPALIGEFDSAQKFATVHSSRTIMLAELQLLLSACEKDASLAEYKEAVI